MSNCKIKQIIDAYSNAGMEISVEEAQSVLKSIEEADSQIAKLTEQQTVEDTSSYLGSFKVDNEMIRKMNDGTWQKLTGDEAMMNLLDGSLFNNIAGMIDAASAEGHKVTTDYQTTLASLLQGVAGALQSTGASEFSHKFEAYMTDQEFSSAFWSDGKGLTDGIIDAGKIVVLIGKDGGFASNMELVAHELVHSATEAAMRSDGKLNRSVAAVQKEAMKQLKYTDLLVHIENPTVSQIQRAKDLITYMNSDPSEFLAYAYSNPNVFNALQNMKIRIDTFQSDSKEEKGFIGLINKLKDILNQIISMISNGPTALSALNQNIDDLIVKNLNVKAGVYTGPEFSNPDEKYLGGKYESTDKFIRMRSEMIAKKIGEMASGIDPRTTRSIHKMINDIMDVQGLRQIRDTGAFQSILHTMFRETTNEDFAKTFEIIRKVRASNDMEQNSLKEANANKIHQWFLDVPAEERIAMTDLLSADVRALGMSKEEIAELLSNPEQLESEIESLRGSIKAQEYINQSRDLGYYLIHGSAKSPILQMNAHRIYHRMYGDYPRAVLAPHLTSDEAISQIDKLASLYALKYIDTANKKHIVSLINRSVGTTSDDVTNETTLHPVDAAINLYNRSTDVERENFGEYNNLFDKGYLRKAYTQQMKSMIVPEDLKNEMVKRGYSNYEFSQPATTMRNDGKKYYVMFARDWSASRTQGAIHDIGFFDITQKMADVYDGSEFVYEEHKERVENYKGMMDYVSDALADETIDDSLDRMQKIPDFLVPVLNLEGKITDYSVPISRASAENYMALDRDIASVLSSTVSHRSAKVRAILNNMAVVEHLLAEEIEKKDNPDYVVIRRATERERASGGYKYEEAWAKMPEYTRDYIARRREQLGLEGTSQIVMHKDMVDDFVGYKDVSIANFKIGKYFNVQNHPTTALRLEQLQYWIQKMVARYKSVIVLLSPDVIIGNATSNMNIAAVHGIVPTDYVKMFTQKWKDLDAYNALQKDLMRLMTERDAGTKGLEGRIAGLKKQLEANSMHELMKDGQFNMIIEDIDTHDNKEDHVEYYKRLMLEKMLGKKGEGFVGNVIENVAMTRNSASFKMAEKLTSYNDIINRAIIRDKMLFELDNNIKSGAVSGSDRQAEERKILNYVDQLFVNYSYLDNRYIKFANDTGLLLFTKYLFRAMKTLKQVYEKKPLGLTLFLGADYSLDKDSFMRNFIDDPYKNYADPERSLENRIGPVASLDANSFVEKLLVPSSVGALW